MKRYRMVHLFFTRLPKADYLERLLSDYASLGANSLLLEYVDRFPYAKHPDLANAESFSPQEVAALESKATSLGLETIPLMQSFAHVGEVLGRPAYRHLSENPASSGQWEYCPRKEDVFELLMDCCGELVQAHPRSEFIHLGCDETWELATCPECGKQDPAEVFAAWVNKLSHEVRRRWGRRTMIWGDMMIPFTCESPTYPEIADLLDKDIVIFYWNYWGTRVFPHLDYYRDKGFAVVAASSSYAAGPSFADANYAVPNVVGFARASSLYDNILGDVITSWAGPPIGVETFIQGMGLAAMLDPWVDPRAAEAAVAKKLFDSDDPRLIDAVYLLGKTPQANDAPWRKLACARAKEALGRHDLSNPYLAALDLNADCYIWESSRLERTEKPVRGGRPWTAAQLDSEPPSLNDQRLSALQQKAPKVLGNLFRPAAAREWLATFLR